VRPPRRSTLKAVTDLPDDRMDLDWFTKEVLCFEPLLTGYLTRVWKNRTEVADLRRDAM